MYALSLAYSSQGAFFWRKCRLGGGGSCPEAASLQELGTKQQDRFWSAVARRLAQGRLATAFEEASLLAVPLRVAKMKALASKRALHGLGSPCHVAWPSWPCGKSKTIGPRARSLGETGSKLPHSKVPTAPP
jgi:hypothetical protein